MTADILKKLKESGFPLSDPTRMPTVFDFLRELFYHSFDICCGPNGVYAVRDIGETYPEHWFHTICDALADYYVRIKTKK